MGNLDFSANVDQLKELATYMASQINVPTIGIGGGYAPIGAIQFFDATVAPQDWLACDGTVYNIADYPQLADWYEAQHGASNFYGGDGTTTFAVPDLQGEFLRGTGTNSHINQGAGANVGEHQDGTLTPEITIDKNGQWIIGNKISEVIYTENPDNKITYGSNAYGENGTFARENNNVYGAITSRPTNTSFLICVKAVVAGEVYSTEERVVGTWIDGKKIYSKTVTGVTGTTATRGVIVDTVLAIDKNIDTPIRAFGGIADKTKNMYVQFLNSSIHGGVKDIGFASITFYTWSETALNCMIRHSMPGWSACQFYVTALYTKTTD